MKAVAVLLALLLALSAVSALHLSNTHAVRVQAQEADQDDTEDELEVETEDEVQDEAEDEDEVEDEVEDEDEQEDEAEESESESELLEVGVSFKQTDAKWSKKQIGTCVGKTIGAKGCAISAVATWLSNTMGMSTNPDVFNTWLTKNKGYGNGGCDIVWSATGRYAATAGKKVSVASGPTSFATLCGQLNGGKGTGAIINVRNGQHWVLATACDVKAGTLKVWDPAYAATSYPQKEVKWASVHRLNK